MDGMDQMDIMDNRPLVIATDTNYSIFYPFCPLY